MFALSNAKIEKIVQFRFSCHCPAVECNWFGFYPQLMPHLLTSHPVAIRLAGNDVIFIITKIEVGTAIDWVMTQTCFDRNFMITFQKRIVDGNYMYYGVAQIIGTSQEAKDFLCCLLLKKDIHQTIWQGTPQSVLEDAHSIIKSQKCLIFDAETARLFADGDDLAINVIISRR